MVNKLKRKSVTRRIRHLLNARATVASKKRVSSVLLVVDLDCFSDIEKLYKIGDAINSKANLTLLGYSSQKKTIKTYKGILFTPAKLGWRGVIKDAEIKTLLKQHTDLLINFYDTNKTGLQLLSASANADFRIGFSGVDKAFSDLIIDCSLDDTSVFQTELIKYLKILNKI